MRALDKASSALREGAMNLLAIPYCDLEPSPAQARFLLDLRRESLYGGAVGGGKTVALLLAALQFADIPGYAALILRTNRTDSTQPGGPLDRAHDVLHGKAEWIASEYTYRFPSTARLVFGFLDHEGDRYRYQGTEFQFIAFDELTQFEETEYRYLFSRLRGPAVGPLARVPVRMRASSNPGGRGHDWVRRHFIEPYYVERKGAAPDPDRSFHPARLTDNPFLDQDEYKATLQFLDPITREQLLNGNWDVRPNGRMFQREWFGTARPDDVPDWCRLVRYWDLAATEATPSTDPDWTVGALVAYDDRAGRIYVCDIVRDRLSPAGVEQLIRRAAERDGRGVTIYIEEEPGSSGKALTDHYRTRVLNGFTMYARRPTGPKTARARPLASRAEQGDIYLVSGPWNDACLDELQLFPDGPHDDQVDAITGALEALADTPYLDPAAMAALTELNRGLRRPSYWTNI